MTLPTSTESGSSAVPGPTARWHCWRPACRERLGGYRSLHLDGNWLVAECHSAKYPVAFDLRVEIWNHWP